jgi:hypothetical protein
LLENSALSRFGQGTSSLKSFKTGQASAPEELPLHVRGGLIRNHFPAAQQVSGSFFRDPLLIERIAIKIGPNATKPGWLARLSFCVD